jgi:alpha-methylacyl-CoA racemase
VENPRLLYARMTGFGQSGRLSRRAGHDLTYLAITGALHAMGHADRPPAPPLNLVADYGGGSMFLVNGILAALIERGVSGQGQVVDAAMIDGVSMLAAPFYAFMAAGHWSGERGANLLDSGAPFYDCYETSDDRFVAVACLEPAFFAIFADLLALSADLKRSQYARGKWPELRAAIAERLAQNTMTHWADLFSETDACVAPVLTFSEAASFPHNESRRSYHESDDWIRPMPAPRLSGSPMKVARPASSSMAFAEVLTDMGFDAGEIETLRQSGAFAEKP